MLGKVLRINLTTKDYSVEELKEGVFKKFLLGRGFGDYILYSEVPADVDPFSPENKLVFAVGPFAGTIVPGTARISVVTKSPLTGTLTSSNAGGHIGLMMALAGYSAIIVEGKSENPLAIYIRDDKVTFLDAKGLMGKTTSETDKLLKKMTHRKCSTIEIGPAGENLSRIAGIFVDGHRAMGRGGVGAVMGYKNLKGIAILGERGIDGPVNKEKFEEKVATIYNLMRNSEGLKRFRTFGTTGNVRTINRAGAFPTRNFRDSYFEDFELINGEEINRFYFVRPGACAQCPVSCNRITRVEWGGKTYIVSGPEYETQWAFGGSTGVSDLKAVLMAHHLANEYGFDGISLGATIACLMDLYEDGYVKDAPFEVKFGDGEAMVKLIEMAGRNEGIGALIKEGSYRLAEHYGQPEYSMSVKKQEFPAYDPRGIKGMGIGYATATRGACHLRGFNTYQEVYTAQDPNYRLQYSDEKVDLLINNQNMRAMQDSIGVCSFVGGYYDNDLFSELLRYLHGIEISGDELYKCGERIWNLENLFNRKAGFGRESDTLPERLFTLPAKSGPSAGEAYDRREFERLLDLYYENRGWDKNGYPLEETLKRLGML